ncbi:capsular biosynthesis protein, partial [Vibrio vulnificus]
INKEKMLETLLEQQHEILERLKRLEEQQKK